jgi:hypothetical protein
LGYDEHRNKIVRMAQRQVLRNKDWRPRAEDIAGEYGVVVLRILEKTGI